MCIPELDFLSVFRKSRVSLYLFVIFVHLLLLITRFGGLGFDLYRWLSRISVDSIHIRSHVHAIHRHFGSSCEISLSWA